MIAKSCDEPALPQGLDRMPVIVCPHVLDRIRARDTVEDVIEPYLIQSGLVARTARGRMLNPAAWKHLGIVPPASVAQLSLLDEEG